MKGIIVNFRQGRTTQKDNHMIIKADGVEKKEAAAKLIGKAVSWKNTKGTEIKGKVASAHGNKGALRVIFEKGMPGQSVGTSVEIK